MASKIEGVEKTDEATIIFVSHETTDSFTRSVDRVANNAWYNAGGTDSERATRFTAARYGHIALDDGRCISTIVYSSSWPLACEILDRLHGPAS